MADKQVVEMPKTKASHTKEQRYLLTEKQVAAVRPHLQEIQKRQEIVATFLGYIQSEAELPESASGWKLITDESGKLCLAGMVPVEKK